MSSVKFECRPLLLVGVALIAASCAQETPESVTAGNAMVTADNAVVTVDAGTKKDAHDALIVLTQFLTHWKNNEIEDSLILVKPALREAFGLVMQRRQPSMKQLHSVKEIRIWHHSDRNVLLASVVVLIAPDEETRMTLELAENGWVMTL